VARDDEQSVIYTTIPPDTRALCVYKKQHTEPQRNKLESKGDKVTSLQRCGQ